MIPAPTLSEMEQDLKADFLAIEDILRKHPELLGLQASLSHTTALKRAIYAEGKLKKIVDAVENGSPQDVDKVYLEVVRIIYS